MGKVILSPEAKAQARLRMARILSPAQYDKMIRGVRPVDLEAPRQRDPALMPNPELVALRKRASEIQEQRELARANPSLEEWYGI